MKKIVIICISLLSWNFVVITQMPKVAIFCSADDKVSERFKQVAYSLGKQLGSLHCGLITGGSKTGLMKEVVDGYASTAQDLKQLYGVMPQVLMQYNVHHSAIPQENFTWTETMHARLATFHALADVIIILPGGFGTLHELMDFLVHNQFALCKKRIILLNPDGFWDNLLAQFHVMVEQKLLALKHLELLTLVSSEQACIEKLVTEQCQAEHGLQTHYWQK